MSARWHLCFFRCQICRDPSCQSTSVATGETSTTLRWVVLLFPPFVRVPGVPLATACALQWEGLAPYLCAWRYFSLCFWSEPLRHIWLDSSFSSRCSQYHTCACRRSCCHLQSEPLGPVYTEEADLTQLVPGDPPPAFRAAEMLTVKTLLLQSDRRHTVLGRHFYSCL